MNVVELEADTALDPETPQGNKNFYQFNQRSRIRLVLTYMQPASPKATMPSMKTLRARPHVPGASALQVPRIT